MGKRILFIDGDQTIVETISTMLGGLGHRVRTETTGMDALAAFSLDPQGYDLVITDLGMPDISGLLLAEKLFKVRHDIPIVLLTSLDGQAQSVARDTGIQWFAMKPICITALAETVEHALTAAA